MFGNPWFLILCEVTWMIHDCSFVLCWLFMSPLFVLNSWTEHGSSDKSSMFCRFCSFPAFLHIWTLSSSDCMILRSIFSHWGHKRCIKSWLLKTFEQDEDFQLFSLLKYIFFPFITALRKQQKILACFPEDKLSTIYLDIQIQKVFTPRLLMHRVSFWSNQWMFWTFFNSCVWVLNCPQCEKMDLKIIQSLLERVQICKNAGKLQNLQNVEDLSEEQCSVQLFRTNKGLMNNQHKTKEQSWIIQVTSHSIKNQGFPNFWRGLFE